jgi:hypothetical protein
VAKLEEEKSQYVLRHRSAHAFVQPLWHPLGDPRFQLEVFHRHILGILLSYSSPSRELPPRGAAPVNALAPYDSNALLRLAATALYTCGWERKRDFAQKLSPLHSMMASCAAHGPWPSAPHLFPAGKRIRSRFSRFSLRPRGAALMQAPSRVGPRAPHPWSEHAARRPSAAAPGSRQRGSRRVAPKRREPPRRQSRHGGVSPRC